MKILVIQQKMIGDVLTSSILFEALRNKYPTASLHYLIYRHTYPVVENNPFIDKFILFEDFQKKINQQVPFLKKIRREKYDVVIDVYSKLGTALISFASGAPKRVSYKKWYTGYSYTHLFPRKTMAASPAGLAIENRVMLLQALDITPENMHRPKIYLKEQELKCARDILERAQIKLQEPLIMVAVMGSTASKTYPAAYLAKLLEQIVEETGARLLFNYIPSQKEKVMEIYTKCNQKTQSHIYLEVFGNSLREFMALTACCDALIGNEGGAVNMAKGLDIPSFAIFSPQIKKEDWGVFENDVSHTSVHLADYMPELFQEKTKKELLDLSPAYYKKFKPSLFSGKLSRFLKTVIPKS